MKGVSDSDSFDKIMALSLWNLKFYECIKTKCIKWDKTDTVKLRFGKKKLICVINSN